MLPEEKLKIEVIVKEIAHLSCEFDNNSEESKRLIGLLEEKLEEYIWLRQQLKEKYQLINTNYNVRTQSNEP